MKGHTYLIIKDLREGESVDTICMCYNTTPTAVYKIAKQYNIPLPPHDLLSEEEKQARKKQADAAYYEKKKLAEEEQEYKLNRPDISMPMLPFVASKRTGLAAYNSSWIFSQGYKRS